MLQEKILFFDLANIARTVLTISHSNADVERIFSQMNVVKTKLHSRMKSDLLNAVFKVKYGLKRNNKICATYIIPNDVIKAIGKSKLYSSVSSIQDDVLESSYDEHDYF